MRADSWILNEIPEYLIMDWYNLKIYTEFDLQATAYFWIRKYFERERSLNWIVRLQPSLILRNKFVKPDIVIYKNTVPYDVMEIKCQLQGFNEVLCRKDLDKLRRLKIEYNMRHAYQIVLYDDNKNISLPSYMKEPWMKNYLTFVGANVHLHKDARKRRNYDQARRRWERFK